MTNFEPRGFLAAHKAPRLSFSSPTTNSKPKLRVRAASRFSAAEIIAAMMPFVSHAPRPRINSSSSLEGKNGGTVSMWVDSVTTGVPHVAKTLKRSGETSICSTAPAVDAASFESVANKNSPATFSRPVMDSMSISERVSAKGSMNPHRKSWIGRERRKRRENREENSGSLPLDSASSARSGLHEVHHT